MAASLLWARLTCTTEWDLEDTWFFPVERRTRFSSARDSSRMASLTPLTEYSDSPCR